MTGGYWPGRGARGREFSSTSSTRRRLHVISHRAMLGLPRELVIELAALLRAERRARGTRTGARLLTCFKQALLLLVWPRTKGDVQVLGAGFGLSRATAYRYSDEGVTVLGYEAAPNVWNALIDRRPSAVARPLGVADVQACVRFAREEGVPLAMITRWWTLPGGWPGWTRSMS
jgi:hypothetical protein